MADPRQTPEDVAELARWAREIHEEIVAIGTEDHERLNRIEDELNHVRQAVDALCRAIGGPARAALDRIEAEEKKATS